MIMKRAAASLCLITVLYLCVLLWADTSKNVFPRLPELAEALPALAGLSFVSFLLRYSRWYWLLSRAGFQTPIGIGFLAYLSGFAFTATPGKVGELVRIRYLAPLGVPRPRVIAAFVYERTFDLFAVLLIATAAVAQFGVFTFVASFVALVVSLVILLARNPSWMGVFAVHLRLRKFGRLSKFVRTIRDALTYTKTWFTPHDIVISLVLGLMAWTVTSYSFVWLLGRLGEAIPLSTAIAVYPLAMLAGAASMLPGGVGSIEAAIVALLTVCNTPLGAATLAAVGIRLSTLWFAIVCGLFAAAVLEWRDSPAGSKT
jgi:uncharacterized protein (TIRG00374 family)